MSAFKDLHVEVGEGICSSLIRLGIIRATLANTLVVSRIQTTLAKEATSSVLAWASLAERKKTAWARRPQHLARGGRTTLAAFAQQQPRNISSRIPCSALASAGPCRERPAAWYQYVFSVVKDPHDQVEEGSCSKPDQTRHFACFQ